MNDAQADQCLDELFDVIERYGATAQELFVLGTSLARAGFYDMPSDEKPMCSRAMLDIVAMQFNAGQPVLNQ